MARPAPAAARRARARALGALLALAAACLLALAAPPAAPAAQRWTLQGAGFGHGVGMSQYGSYGFARRGRGYRDILGHYYTGTTLSRVRGGVVRVLLQPNRSSISFTGAERAGPRGLRPASVYNAVRRGGIVVLRKGGRTLARFSGVLPVYGGATFRVLGRQDNGVTSGLYRGSLEIRTARGPGLNGINVVALEDYLQGVVPAEVPPVWPAEALKAQAVAARSYALATGVGGLGFNQYADTRSQMYRGFLAENATSNAAVAATRGEVITYGGSIVVTYFFSTSGGETENVENVFFGSAAHPWLRGVRDPYDDASPYHRWGPYKLARSTIERRLGDLVRGRFRDLDVVERGVSPRVVSARVVGTRGTRRATGPQLRARLGLRDTWFSLRRVSTRKSAARARVSSGTRRLTAIFGEVKPIRSRFVRLERRAGGRRWVLVAKVPLDRAGKTGRYRFHVGARGDYRIRAGWASGPTIHAP
jgi:stage II sporulation protein D